MNAELKSIGQELEIYVKAHQKILHENINGQSVDANLNLIFLIIIMKNIDSLCSISKLFQHVSIEYSYFGIASLLRGNLLNGIIALYLSNKMEQGKNDLEQAQVRKEIEIIYIDQLKHTIRDLKYLFESGPNKDARSVIESINEDYAYYLKSPIVTLNKIEFIHNEKRTPKYMVNNSRIKELSLSIYDNYIYYSKMEHLGLLTYSFFSRIYDEQEVEIKKIKNSIHDIVLINKAFNHFLMVDDERREELFTLTSSLENKLKK